MSKSDVAGLQQKDQEDWKKRGTTGTVTAIDPAAKTVTIKSGSRTFTVQPSDKTGLPSLLARFGPLQRRQTK